MHACVCVGAPAAPASADPCASDVQGVALAAIQGLNAKLDARLVAKEVEIASMRSEMAELRLALEALSARVAAR